MGTLIGLVAAIALGSFAFHTVPNVWTVLADIIPIQLFAFGYFALAMRRFIALRPVATSLATALFLGVSALLAALLPPFLPVGAKGSAGYAAFALALFGTAALAARQSPATAGGLAFAGTVFALSLAARTLDRPLCHALPFGTHWLWHLLNAAVLYILLRTALRATDATTARGE